MKTYSLALLSAIAILAVGCSINIESSTPAPPAPMPPAQPHTNFRARINAADSITSFSKRDNALAYIAVEAARECDISNTLKALSKISSFSKGDSAAEKCADIFLSYNMIGQARKIADTMTSFYSKNRVLSKIAKASIQ